MIVDNRRNHEITIQQKRSRNNKIHQQTHRTITMHYHDDEEDDNNNHPDGGVTSILTPEEILEIGLIFGGYTMNRMERSNRTKNIDRFISLYGSTPTVCAAIWEDLQQTQIEEARVEVAARNINHFLMALHQLKRYPTDFEREAKFDISLMWGRDWCWFFVEKIQALKNEKIVWPENNFDDDIWVMTVDGTHCWIQEPQHPTWSQDREYFSHKHGKAGLNYELGISLSESKLIWMNGPFKVGMNDVQIFREKGLLDNLLEKGKMAIGDKGYNGHPGFVSTPNPHDPTAVKKFKSRASKRHETFNARIKTFDCLNGRFRHSVKRFASCFEAVCVICQYQIEIDYPLFDLLVEELIEE